MLAQFDLRSNAVRLAVPTVKIALPPQTKGGWPQHAGHLDREPYLSSESYLGAFRALTATLEVCSVRASFIAIAVSRRRAEASRFLAGASRARAPSADTI